MSGDYPVVSSQHALSGSSSSVSFSRKSTKNARNHKIAEATTLEKDATMFSQALSARYVSLSKLNACLQKKFGTKYAFELIRDRLILNLDESLSQDEDAPGGNKDTSSNPNEKAAAAAPAVSSQHALSGSSSSVSFSRKSTKSAPNHKIYIGTAQYNCILISPRSEMRIPWENHDIALKKARQISSGLFSDVYSLEVEVQPSNERLLDGAGTEVVESSNNWTVRSSTATELVAIKRVHQNSRALFSAEAYAFQKLGELTSGKSNLIEPLCMLSQSLSFVLPLAQGDLENFWNKDSSSAIEDFDIRSQIGPLAGGLSTLHSADIAHCDLCPANILLFNTESGNIVLKIADFGHSVPFPFTEASDTTISKDTFARRSNKGTYTAPECWSGSRRNPKHIDIWALGCIILEMLAFFNGGPKGVSDLRAVRRGLIQGTELTSDTFHDGIKLRVEIQAFISILEEHPASSVTLATVRDMLDENPEERPTAEVAARSLAHSPMIDSNM